jgi:hypothetical protein
MNDEAGLNLGAIELEEARLRERQSDLAEFKRLATKLKIAVPGLTPAPVIASSFQPPSDSGTSFAAPRIAIVLAGGHFDGTFAGLIGCYRKHPESPYHHLKYAVRISYDNTFKRLIQDIGSERIADWNARRITSVYETMWSVGGKLSMGRTLIAKMRLLCTFGSTVLNDDGCIRLSAILGNMRFATSKGDGEPLSIEHVRAIRATARGHFGWDSIALAQAFQFELPKLRQVGVIGEWVPLSEPGTSDVVKENEKWVRGLRWSDIDENMILRRTLASPRGKPKDYEFNLKRHAMIAEEINRVPMEKRKGPMIICEYTMMPWSPNEFRRKWRIVADKAGVPATVRNGGALGHADKSAQGVFG